MDPELVKAILERIKSGRSKDEIQAEVLAVGHDLEYFEHAYQEASMALNSLKTEVFPVSDPELSPVPDSSFDFKRLLNNSWSLFTQNLNLLGKSLFAVLILVLGVGLSLFSAYYFIDGSSVGSFLVLGLTVVMVFLAAVVLMVTVSSSLLRALLHRSERLDFTAHLKWSLLNFISITLVSFYVSILTQVGYMFFVIPGLMAAYYFIFAPLVVIDGVQKGIPALTHGLSLVYGRFWGVLVRILFSIIPLMVVVLTIGITGALILSLSPFFLPVFIIFSVVAFVLFGYWQICFFVTIYESVKENGPAKALPLAESKLILSVKIIIGLALVAMITMFVFVGWSTLHSGYEGNIGKGDFWAGSETSLDKDLKFSLVEASGAVEKYRTDNGSYADVCGTLFLNEFAKCESDAERYALEVPLSKGFYCLDSNGYNEVTRRSALDGVSCKDSSENSSDLE